MDYDDNDCQNQQFQLGGEDNSNFLRPFSLPKFDLDEHLQVHLRFDSLDDSEDILGIRVQEGNNWIQDFSAGSRGIQFSASAAESCSISHQKNIWSEATSTESVEMLLKSVGEDDMLTNKNITDSISDDVLNHENNDATTRLHTDVCMENAINDDSPPICSNSSPGKNGTTSVTASHVVDVVSQSSEDGDCHDKESKELVMSLESDEVVSIRHCDSSMHSMHPPVIESEDSIREVSPLDGNSQLGVSHDCGLADPYLESGVPNDFAGNLAENVSDMMHLSTLPVDFVSSLDITIMNEVASVDSSNKNSDNDFEGTLASQKQVHQSLLPDTEIDHCHHDRHMPVGSCSASKLFSISRVETSSSDVMSACGNAVICKKSDGLLEVIIDEMKFSEKGSDVLASEEEHQQILQTNSEICHRHSDENACITGEIHSNTRSQVEPLDMMDSCIESVHSKGSDGLLEVIVGSISFSNKDNELGNDEDVSLEKDEIKMQKLFSSEKVEATEGIIMHEKSSESVHGNGGSELNSSLLVKEEVYRGNLEMSDDKEHVASEFTDAIPNLTNTGGEVHSFENIESAEAELQGHMADISSNIDGHGVDSHISSSEMVTNDIEKEDKHDTQFVDSNNIASTPLLLSTDTESMQISLAAPPDNGKLFIVSPLTDKCTRVSASSGVLASVDDGSIIKGEMTDSPQVSTGMLASVCKSPSDMLTGEAKSDTVTEGSPTSEILGVSTDLQDTEKPTDVSGAFDSKDRGISALPIPGSDLSSNDQNDAKFHVVTTERYSATPEDTMPFPPCDVHSSKNESETDNSGEPKSHFIQTAIDPNVGINDSTGCLNASAGGTCTSGQKGNSVENATTHISSSCAVVLQPLELTVASSSLENNNGASASISFSETSQAEVQKDDTNKVSSVQTLPVLAAHAMAEVDLSSGKINSPSENCMESGATLVDKSFTFEVGQELSDKNVTDKCKLFSDDQSSKSGSETPVVSSIEKYDSEQFEKGSSLEKEVICNEIHALDATTKSAAKEKNRQIASPSGSKKKSVKESQILKKAADKSRKNAASSSLEEIEQPSSEGFDVKPSCSTVQPSNLPDLNTTASGTSLFTQPFTDAQQVQLRAQILVYGYLIQGIPPEEACMASAFGDSDGGRITWEDIWRAFSEKYRSQKSPILRTPSRPVSKPLDQASPYAPFQSRVSSSACQTGSMTLQSPIWNATPQELPLSNISRGALADPGRVLPPLHSYQSPHVRQYTAGSAPWPGQSPVSAVSLLPSGHSSLLGANTPISTLRSGESSQLPPSREFSTPHISTAQFMTPGIFSSVGAAGTVSAIPAMQTDAVSPSANKQASCEPKSRKRKKVNDSDTLKQLVVVSQPQLEPLSAGGSSKPWGFSTSINASNKLSSVSLVPNAVPIVAPTHFQVLSTGQSDRVVLADETSTKIEQARQQAEDSAAFASAAVRHSEGVWNQLAFQRNSGLISEAEQKLASAAVAAAAAACVAKAAAAAAKVAADAALQAKMTSDEALASNKLTRASVGAEVGLLNSERSLVNASSATVIKPNDTTSSSSSIISAAREGARRRVEAASAAAKRAEILDAIVKAAELAAGAVAQAGAIVAMGDPLPFTLNDILDRGPENYWKTRTQSVIRTNINSGTEMMADDIISQVQSISTHPNQILTSRKDDSQPKSVLPLDDIATQPVQNCPGGLSGGATATVTVDGDDRDRLGGSGHTIKEGSIVEVLTDENGVGSIWHSARVLDVKDGQAHVCYNTLLADEGSAKLKAWIPLKAEDERPPRIRIAHPMTTVKYGGTRKRRREVVATHAWNVGDKVDAWIRDGWWEGVICEKSSDDENRLTVRLSASGASSVVRSWDLRSSLVWKSGTWIEWSQLKEKNISVNEDDIPREKRQKLSGSKTQGLVHSEDSDANKPSINDIKKSDVHGPLTLSAKDQMFSVGKTTDAENSPERGKRTAVQKQASRVVFGVPKPGKKRKFMDVSKQCVVDNRERVKEGSSSMKFAKYLMPQSSHAWKTGQKVDQKDKRAADFKSRTTRSTKPHTAVSRKVVDREGSSTSTLAATSCDGGNSRGPLNVGLSSSSMADTKLEKNIHLEVSLSNTMQTLDNPALLHQLHSTPGVSSAKQFGSDAEGEIANKGKQPSVLEKSARNDDRSFNLVNNSGRTSSANEPRRSNRRIQPTSRLLEGLQSSLMISKVPGSHEKSTKPVQRGGLATRGRILRSHG